MATSGLLILTQPLSHLRALIPRVIEEAAVVVNETLYVYLQPALQNRPLPSSPFLQPLLCTREVQSVVSDLYLSGSNVCTTLDVRVLLAHICTNPSTFSMDSYSLKKEVSVLLSDSPVLRDTWNSGKTSLTDSLRITFRNMNSDVNFCFIKAGGEQEASNSSMASSASPEILEIFPNTVLGGTFDRLHMGHKLLLTESCLRCEKKLTVGITDGERNKKKQLWELMEPYEVREQCVVNFVTDVKPNIDLVPVKIFDPFGPTITDPDLQCIVVSQETQAGGDMVNDERIKKGFPTLKMFSVDLVDDACHAEDEEAKISSSSFRKRLLGTLLRPLASRPCVAKSPYRIAVTGGIASGKSNVCSELEKLGCKIINCDHLGHKAYVKGTKAFDAIVKEFGDSVVGKDGEINRAALGPIVFSDKSKMEKLNSIVWPAIRELVEEDVEIQRKAGVKFVVLEAAVLLEAGWDDMAHEVWTTFIPREQAVKRIMNRNNLSEAEAEKRIDSQISNEARIAKSNVVICPQWDFSDTRKQVLKAWALLQDRMVNIPQTKL